MSPPHHKTYVVALPGGPCGPQWDPKCPHAVANRPHHVGTVGNLGERAFKQARSHGITVRLPRLMPRATRGPPKAANPGKRDPPKNCVNFVPRTSRMPLGDAKLRKDQCKAEIKGFPMIPSFLANSPSVSRSVAPKLAQGHLPTHPFTLDCAEKPGILQIAPKKGTFMGMLHGTEMVRLAPPTMPRSPPVTPREPRPQGRVNVLKRGGGLERGVWEGVPGPTWGPQISKLTGS